MIKDKGKIIHLNLSYNNFSYDECDIIAEMLKDNHTIYGFHFAGHYGYVDNLGFFIL